MVKLFPSREGRGRQALELGHGSENPPRRYAIAVAARHPSGEGIFLEAFYKP